MLEVIYLIFNEGYSATAGDDWIRPALCEEALRLGRILAELIPDEPEVHGLVALMEIQASRLGARTGPGGEPVLLLDQDRARWDQLLIRRGLAALARAERAEEPGARCGPVRTVAGVPSPPAMLAPPGRRHRLEPHRRALRRPRPSSPRLRWSSSTGRSPSRWRPGPRPACELVDALVADRRSPATTCCRACAAICW